MNAVDRESRTRPPERRRVQPPTLERRDMTICIASLCSNGHHDRRIILCADWKRGGFQGSSETFLKIRHLRHNWVVMTSGDDDEIKAVTILFRKAFQDFAEEIDETNIKSIVRDVMLARKREKSDELVRGDYGLTLDEFTAKGKSILTEDLYRDELLKIRAVCINATFIIAGFVGNFPILMDTDPEGHVHIRKDFAVVGEGNILAQSVLLHRGLTDVTGPAKGMYITYEAKRYAEGAPSVGRWTTLSLMDKDGNENSVSGDMRLWLEREYARFGPKPIDGLMPPPDLSIFGEERDDTLARSSLAGTNALLTALSLPGPFGSGQREGPAQTVPDLEPPQEPELSDETVQIAPPESEACLNRAARGRHVPQK